MLLVCRCAWLCTGCAPQPVDAPKCGAAHPKHNHKLWCAPCAHPSQSASGSDTHQHSAHPARRFKPSWAKKVSLCYDTQGSKQMVGDGRGCHLVTLFNYDLFTCLKNVYEVFLLAAIMPIYFFVMESMASYISPKHCWSISVNPIIIMLSSTKILHNPTNYHMREMLGLLCPLDISLAAYIW